MFCQSTARRKQVLRYAACFIVLLCFTGTQIRAEESAPDIEAFVRTGCPHCEAAKNFLDELRRERPSLHITLSDIAEDSSARQRLVTLAKDRGITSIGVPAFLIGTELIVGFRSSDTTGAEIRAKLKQNAPDAASPPIQSIESEWFGPLRVHDLGLPLFTVLIGLMDGFNPCAMWVLLFLLSLLVNLHDRRKMALIAGTFVIVSGLLYFAFMAAWLNVFLVIGLSRSVQIGLGGIALLIGAVNVKDFFALHQGLSLSIPESAKPGFTSASVASFKPKTLPGPWWPSSY